MKKILFCFCMLLQSCSIIYRTPYYKPTKDKTWFAKDNLSRYQYPRSLILSKQHIEKNDTLLTIINIVHNKHNIGKPILWGWYQPIPIIPFISFKHKYIKRINSEINFMVIVSSNREDNCKIDRGKVSFLINSDVLMYPSNTNCCMTSIDDQLGTSLLKFQKTYIYNLKITDVNIQKKIKTISIHLEEPQFKWLNDEVFIRKNKTTFELIEGMN